MKITAEKILRFAELSGDHNPIHLDDKASPFGQRIAHGMLVASLISAEIARQYPKAIYVRQDLRFLAPVFVDDEVRVEIEAKDEEKFLALKTFVFRGQEAVLSGEAVILCG